MFISSKLLITYTVKEQVMNNFDDINIRYYTISQNNGKNPID